MKKALGLFSILFLLILFQGCETVDETSTEISTYNIVVINDSIFTLRIYLDNAFQFTVDDFSKKIIRNVISGRHILRAIWVDDEVLFEKTLYINRDTTWRLSYK